MKNKISSIIIKKTLKSRLSSQRRIFKFDNKHILVLPFLEHNDNIDAAVNNIRFYIGNKSQFKLLSDIKQIGTQDNKVVLKLNNGDDFNLFYKKMDGSFSETQFEKLTLDKLSIDHSPSIFVVLYSHYLKKSNTFDILANFCNKILVNSWNTKNIKKRGFKKEVENILNKSSNKDEILKAYNDIFKDINLEITLRENNNANLSLESLIYYKQHN